METGKKVHEWKDKHYALILFDFVCVTNQIRNKCKPLDTAIEELLEIEESYRKIQQEAVNRLTDIQPCEIFNRKSNDAAIDTDIKNLMDYLKGYE